MGTIITTVLADFWVIIPTVVFSVIVALLLVVVAEGWFGKLGEKRDELKKVSVLAFALALLGAVAGVCGGTSREAAVGDIIPAAIGLVGGVSLYLFGIEQSRGLIASVCAVAFALALGTAYAGGAGTRGRADVERDFLSFCRTSLSNADLLGNKDAFCRFQSTFGETCAHYISKEIVADDTVQSDIYSREAHYKDVYGIMLANLNDQLKSTQSCGFHIFDRKSQASSGRFMPLPKP